MRQNLNNIEPIELEELLAKKDDETILVDIRDKIEIQNEFEDQDNVINLPLKALDTQYDLLEPFKNKTIVLVCHSGMRAQKAQKFLEKKGFENLRVLKGGVVLWEKFKSKKKH
ncbi:MAG: rhodanese-like domain-containing protein [Eubacterium sp.]